MGRETVSEFTAGLLKEFRPEADFQEVRRAILDIRESRNEPFNDVSFEEYCSAVVALFGVPSGEIMSAMLDWSYLGRSGNSNAETYYDAAMTICEFILWKSA